MPAFAVCFGAMVDGVRLPASSRNRAPSRLAWVLATAIGFSILAPAAGVCDQPADHGKTTVVTVERGGYSLKVLCGDDAASAAAKAATDRRTAMDDHQAVRELARRMQSEIEAQTYTPPDVLDKGTANERMRVLKTGGLYSRRAVDHSKREEYRPAIADLLRALLRPGLDPTAEDKLTQTLQDFLKKAAKKRAATSAEGDLTELFEAFDLEDDTSSLEAVNQDQLKKLYRQLSVKYHPDKSPDNAQRFNQIRDAYEILSNPVKVLLYDTGGMDLVKKFEGGKADLASTAGVELNVHVSLKDVYMGAVRTVKVDRRIICRSCRTQPHLPRCSKCQKCPGEKHHRQRWLNQMQYTMEEYEVPSDEKCTRYASNFEVAIEKGMLNGDRINHPHMADQLPKHIPGHVTVGVQVDKHPHFKRSQNDLIVTIKVSLYEALMGFERELVHLDGHIVKFGLSRGQVLKPGAGLEIHGEGMPMREDPSSFGRLLVMFEIEFPTTVTDEAANSFESAFRVLGQGPGETRLAGGLKRNEL